MAMTENIRGAAFMTGAMVAFTVNDAAMKMLAPDMPLFQAIFLRSVLVSLMLLVLLRARPRSPAPIARRDWTLILFRSVMEVFAAILFLSALFNMPIANVTAILQVLPLTVSLAGAAFLGETIGWRRLVAILVGFVGVLLIVRPGGDGFSVYSIFALLAVVCVTARDIAARKLSKSVPTLPVALVTVVMIGVFSGLGSVTEPWVSPDVSMYGLVVLASGFVIGGYILSISAMRVGDIAAITPFRYTSLLAALVLGLVFFGEWPDALTLVGAAIVVGTGTFTLLRERRLEPPALPPK